MRILVLIRTAKISMADEMFLQMFLQMFLLMVLLKVSQTTTTTTTGTKFQVRPPSTKKWHRC